MSGWGDQYLILMAKASALSSAVRHLCGVTPTSLSNGGGSVIYSAWRGIINVSARCLESPNVNKTPTYNQRPHVLAADLCARCSMWRRWATSASVMTHVQRNNGLGAQYGGFSISRQRRSPNRSAWRNLNVPRAAPIGGSLSFLLSYYKFFKYRCITIFT